MIIGEGPGKDEDKSGLPFVGYPGRYLDHILEGTSITRVRFFREDLAEKLNQDFDLLRKELVLLKR